MRPTSGETSVRRPAVAGLFYPDDPLMLRAMVSEFLRRGTPAHAASPLKALIVPHAGYVYSGAAAAAAYALAAAQREVVRRIVLIGPSHRVYLRGAAVPTSGVFATPLGDIKVDPELHGKLVDRGDVVCSDEPHEMEHSLEVQLPFLQTVFENFTVLPIVVGAASPDYVASVLSEVWGGSETLLIASSDLSHYLPYESARQIDAATSAAIQRYDTGLSGEQACGAVALNGLLKLARERGLNVSEITRCNSGDTAGDRRRVVGYGAFALRTADPAQTLA